MPRIPGGLLICGLLTVHSASGADRLGTKTSPKTSPGRSAPDPKTSPGRSAPDPVEKAPARRHWAFQPVRDPAPPAVKDGSWPAGDLDRFILAKLEEKGLAPVEDADPRTLLRRMTFDLTGLPPEPAEIDAFLAGGSEGAVDRWIERLLASPHYGERWGRHWLDVVRYADTAGDNSDYPVPEAYKYRNYVIRSFNIDEPYDRFLREQIAGDLLPAASEEERAEHLIATGFLALSKRFASDPNREYHLTIDNALDTLGRAILGISLSCARCHDHKFDPIPARDYYAMYGILASTRFPFPGCELEKRPRDLVPLIPGDELHRLLAPVQPRLDAANAELARMEAEAKELDQASKKGLPQPPREPGKPGLDELRERIRDKRTERDKITDEIPYYEKAYAVSEGVPADARIQERGNPDELGSAVPRGFIEVLGGGPLPAGAQGSGRLELASWLVGRGNPLTARVIANRIWLHHFGRGIVPTPSDFGTQGEPPTHPELLDWLASRLVEGGWSIKGLHRIILRSRTYRLSSRDDPRNAIVDPGSQYLWRFWRRRLDAESIRDALLAVSGDLDREPGGAHPFPPVKTWKFTQHNQFSAVYETRKRSVYLMTSRLQKHPHLALFDGPDPSSSTGERLSTTTPVQALFAMNSPLLHEQAEKLAARLLAAEAAEEGRLRLAFRLAFGREPGTDEARRSAEALALFRERLGEGAPGGEEREKLAFASLARVLLASNEFFFVD